MFIVNEPRAANVRRGRAMNSPTERRPAYEPRPRQPPESLMNVPTLIVGVLALGYGIGTVCVRVCRPDAFGKLRAMKAAYGETAGNAVHIVAYSVVPAAVGCVLLYFGFTGVSIF